MLARSGPPPPLDPALQPILEGHLRRTQAASRPLPRAVSWGMDAEMTGQDASSTAASKRKRGRSPTRRVRPPARSVEPETFASCSSSVLPPSRPDLGAEVDGRSRKAREREAAMVRRRHREIEDARREGWELTPTQVLSVSRPVRKSYLRHLRGFRRWLGRRDSCLKSGRLLDKHLSQYLNEQFGRGADLGLGQKLVAAVKFQLPEFSKNGKERLPRSAQTMAGWRKRNPPRARLPLPWEAFAAILIWLVRVKGERQLARGLALAYHAYLRPVDLFGLRVGQLFPPVQGSRSARRWGLVMYPRELGVPSKTGAYDESVVLGDVPLYKEIPAVLQLLVAHRPRSQFLVEMPRHRALQLLVEGARAVGAGSLAPVLHSLRHGGPSTDVAMGARSLGEVMKRGRWQSMRSVARYARGGRVGEQLSGLPTHVVTSLCAAERSLWSTLRSS